MEGEDFVEVYGFVELGYFSKFFVYVKFMRCESLVFIEVVRFVERGRGRYRVRSLRIERGRRRVVGFFRGFSF